MERIKKGSERASEIKGDRKKKADVRVGVRVR